MNRGRVAFLISGIILNKCNGRTELQCPPNLGESSVIENGKDGSYEV